MISSSVILWRSTWREKGSFFFLKKRRPQQELNPLLSQQGDGEVRVIRMVIVRVCSQYTTRPGLISLIAVMLFRFIRTRFRTRAWEAGTFVEISP